MATDLQSHKSPTKAESYLDRQIKGLCARIRRADVFGCILTLALAVSGYALLMGLIDVFAGDAGWLPAFRWCSYAAFVGVLGFLLVRTARCMFRRINPYYVARQLEHSLPDAKNSLINWLDLREENLPGAFRKNLSASAVEHFDESDPEPTLRRRQNGIMLGLLAVPVLGLIILLIVSRLAFVGSMMQAFLPFVDTSAARTHITLLLPESGDAETGPAQPVAFLARIEGRVPARNRADAPRLHYRYQPTEDFLTLPLQPDVDGTWRGQLLSTQVRSGFTYKITAGDAATPEYQVRVRAPAHAKQFEVAYLHRPYRKLSKTTMVFPNDDASRPHVHGLRGTEVELTVHASRPVQQASVEILTNGAKKDLPIRKLPGDPHAFTCRWILEQPGQCRVAFTSVDGEDNTDRDPFDIDVSDDAIPRVVLTQPGKDVSLPANGTLELEGHASDDVGLKSLALHLRVVQGPDRPEFPPRPYRPGKSFQLDNGTYPQVIEYKDFVALDQLKDAKRTTTYLSEGTVLEYWLEATDNSDYPSAKGNIGKSEVYKLTLLAALPDSKELESQRRRAQQQKDEHDKRQDDRQANDNKQQKPGGAGPEDLRNQKEKQEKELQSDKDRIKNALAKEDQENKSGSSKDADKKSGEKKPGPQGSPDGAKPKDQKPMSPDDAGKKKDQGGDQGSAGKSKDGNKEGGPKDSPKGDRKEGPKEPSSPAKDQKDGDKKDSTGGAKKDGPPPMPQPKGAPGSESTMPQVKPEAKDNSPKEGSAKGTGPGEPEKADKEPSFDSIAKLHEQLANGGEAGKAAGKELANLAKQAKDETTRDLAAKALEINDRDPDTGEPKPVDSRPKSGAKGDPGKEKKGPNPFGTAGKSSGISDDVKRAAANREFARKIGQMQLDHWKKRVTPEVLQKAGMTQADWQRFLSGMQSYDTLVRRLNAQLTSAHARALKGGRPSTGAAPTLLEAGTTSHDALERVNSSLPPDLLDAQRRFNRSQEKPPASRAP